MKRFVQPAFAAGAIFLLAGPASAQLAMPSGTPKAPAATPVMMAECHAMMQEMIADPVARARMMAIMKKHMQHGGQGSMMMPGMSGGKPAAKTMQNGAVASPSAHDAHRPETPTMASNMAPTPTAVPLATPSP